MRAPGTGGQLGRGADDRVPGVAPLGQLVAAGVGSLLRAGVQQWWSTQLAFPLAGTISA